MAGGTEGDEVMQEQTSPTEMDEEAAATKVRNRIMGGLLDQLASNRTDYLRLASGRTIYAHCGIFGLSLHGNVPGLREGFDGNAQGGNSTVEDWWDDEAKAEHQQEMLTQAERDEIAAAMTARWEQWRQIGR